MRPVSFFLFVFFWHFQFVVADRRVSEDGFSDSEEESQGVGKAREINAQAQSEPTFSNNDRLETIRVQLKEAQRKHVKMEQEHKEAHQNVQMLKNMQISADPDAKSTCYFEPLASKWMLGLGLPAKTVSELRIGQWNLGNGAVVPSLEFVSGEWIQDFWGDVEKKLGRIVIELSGSQSDIKVKKGYARYFNQTPQFERDVDNILGHLRTAKLSGFLVGFDHYTNSVKSPFHHLFQQCWQATKLVDILKMAMEKSDVLNNFDPMDFALCQQIKPSRGNIFRNADGCYDQRRPRFADEGYIDWVNYEGDEFWERWWDGLATADTQWGGNGKCYLTVEQRQTSPTEFLASSGDKFSKVLSPFSDLVPLATYDYLRAYVTKRELEHYRERDATFSPPVFTPMTLAQSESALLAIVKRALLQLDVLFLQEVGENMKAELMRLYNGVGGWHVACTGEDAMVIANLNLLVAEDKVREKLEETSLAVDFKEELGQLDLNFLAKKSNKKAQNLKTQFEIIISAFASQWSETAHLELRPKNFDQLNERWKGLQDEFKKVEEDMGYALQAADGGHVAAITLGNAMFVAVHSDSKGSFVLEYIRMIKRIAEKIRTNFGCAQLEYVVVGIDSNVQPKAIKANKMCDVLANNNQPENMVFDYKTMIDCAANEGFYEADLTKDTKLKHSVAKVRSFAQAQFQKGGKIDQTRKDHIFYHKIKPRGNEGIRQSLMIPEAVIKNSVHLPQGQDFSGQFPNEAWPTDHFMITTNLKIDLSEAQTDRMVQSAQAGNVADNAYSNAYSNVAETVATNASTTAPTTPTATPATTSPPTSSATAPPTPPATPPTTPPSTASTTPPEATSATRQS